MRRSGRCVDKQTAGGLCTVAEQVGCFAIAVTLTARPYVLRYTYSSQPEPNNPSLPRVSRKKRTGVKPNSLMACAVWAGVMDS